MARTQSRMFRIPPRTTFKTSGYNSENTFSGEAGINHISTINSSCFVTAQRSDQNFESTNIIFNPTTPLNFDNIYHFLQI